MPGVDKMDQNAELVDDSLLNREPMQLLQSRGVQA